MNKNVSVICAIVKNEQRFIREWVEYCLSIGFDKLYIYEDYGSETHKNELNDYIEQGKVELTSLDESDFTHRHRKGTLVQRELYRNFFQRCKDENLADWAGFFDVDEFMMFEDGWNLERLENEFEDCGGVLLSWRLYGANGHMKRPKGNVVDNYTTHLEDGALLDAHIQWNVKSLVNVKNCPSMKHIHVFNGCLQTNHGTFTKDSKPCFEKAWLNHYYTKSWEDYLDRIFARGNMQNNFRCLDKFFVCNPELMPRKKEMVMAQRYRHAASTMWISREMKVISGGNEGRLKELTAKYLRKDV